MKTISNNVIYGIQIYSHSMIFLVTLAAAEFIGHSLALFIISILGHLGILLIGAHQLKLNSDIRVSRLRQYIKN